MVKIQEGVAVKATKVEVGQIRDVATGADVKRGVKRYAKVVKVHPNTGLAYVTNLSGGRERSKDLVRLARCRIVPPEEVSP